MTKLMIIEFLLNYLGANKNKPIPDEENKENFEIWVIWLNPLDLETDTNIISTPECNHKYHKNWFKENAEHNTKFGFIQCPLCRKKVGVIILNSK